MDRLARLRLGAETFQASSGKSHRPAQLGPTAVPRCGSLSRARIEWQTQGIGFKGVVQRGGFKFHRRQLRGFNPTATMRKSKIRRAERP